jgi:hypothetical protein
VPIGLLNSIINYDFTLVVGLYVSFKLNYYLLN